VTGADPELAAGADDDPSEPELDVARSRATMADTVRSSLLGMRTPFHGRAVT
jgi:hypothetical protein